MTKAFVILLNEETDDDGNTRLRAVVRDGGAEDPADLVKLEVPAFRLATVFPGQRVVMYQELFIAVARALHERCFPDDKPYFDGTKKKPAGINGSRSRIILPN